MESRSEPFFFFFLPPCYDPCSRKHGWEGTDLRGFLVMSTCLMRQLGGGCGTLWRRTVQLTRGKAGAVAEKGSFGIVVNDGATMVRRRRVSTASIKAYAVRESGMQRSWNPVVTTCMAALPTTTTIRRSIVFGSSRYVPRLFVSAVWLMAPLPLVHLRSSFISCG